LPLLGSAALAAFRGQNVTVAGDRTVVRQSPTSALPLDKWALSIGLGRERSTDPIQPGDFWEFIPSYLGSTSPAAELTFETPCYKSVSITAALTADGEATLKIAASGKKQLLSLCGDAFLITTTKSFHTETMRSLLRSMSHTIDWSGFDANELADVAANGFRVFRFSKSLLAELPSLIETARLFLQPMVSASVSTATSERNINFLKTYAPGALGPHFGEKRQITDVIPDEDEIADGDQFCILRLDGLDPMIGWGTGGNCGHSVMAIRIDGVLHVIESQVKSAYWPVDFVQRNKFSDWITYAKKASYNVLHLRLSAASRAKFNATAAIAAFESQYEGLLYGYETLLWGWFDLGNDNFPSPLDVHAVTTIFSILDPILSPLLGKTPSLWNNALAQRLGLGPGVGGTVSFGMSTRELLGIATARNLSMTDLIRVAERDDWVYPRDDSACGRKAGCTGPSQVCNVFVCKMWKAGGLFDVDFNCGEQVPLDTYQMNIYDKAPPLSAACKAADPMNTQYCQILGDYRLELLHYSTVTPFAHMRELCPSKAGNYTKRFSPAVDASC